MSDLLKGIIGSIVTAPVLCLLSLAFKPVRDRFFSFIEYIKLMRSSKIPLKDWPEYIELAKNTGLPPSELVEYIRLIKFSGLRCFLKIHESVNKFDEMIKNGKPGDDILIVGRTLVTLITAKKDKFIDGIRKCINFKLLILNPQKVNENMADLTVLRCKDPNRIPGDLEKAIEIFGAICNYAKNNGYLGSFEVHTTDLVVLNSLTGHKGQEKSHVIFDFSFTDQDSDKYKQYYECIATSPDEFPNKLYDFYGEIFANSQLFIKYAKGTITRGELPIAKIVKEGTIESALKKHSESEEIRNNDIHQLLPFIPDLFDAILDQKADDLPAPISVQIEITNRCNTKCSHCRRYTWGKQRGKSDMPLPRFKAIVDDLYAFGVSTVTLSGGEPTLHTDFKEFLHYAVGRGLRVGILSNGLAIDQGLAEAILNHAAWIRISLDASNAETYKTVRGTDGGFDKVINSLRTLKKAKRANLSKCKIGICYSLQKENIATAPDLLNYLYEEDLIDEQRPVTFKFVHGHGSFLPEMNQIKSFCNNILNQDNPRWAVNFSYLRKFIKDYSSLEDIKSGVPLKTYIKKNKNHCFTPFLFSLIDVFENVYPCCFYYPDNDSYDVHRISQYTMGYLAKNTFESIWRGKEYIDFRTKCHSICNDTECERCTRHYLYNAILTELFTGYNKFQESANEDEMIICRKLFKSFQPDKNNGAGPEIWL